jgi:hypothetical protein
MEKIVTFLILNNVGAVYFWNMISDPVVFTVAYTWFSLMYGK